MTEDQITPTGGQARSIICLPNRTVDGGGEDIDLSYSDGSGTYADKKENNAKDVFYFLFVNLGAEPIYVAFDSDSSSIDTGDTDNDNQT